MTGWDALARELDAWRAEGRVATVWWRDDDAVEPSPALERLLETARRTAAPLALAVIPARAGHALAGRLADGPDGTTVLQHGFAHRNHAAPSAKKIELGGRRPAAAALEELARGRARMAALFGAEAARILVPPWNRVAPDLLPGIAEIGFSGLSACGPRPASAPVPGLAQVNCHVDIMRWEAPRGFGGVPAALDALVGHLRARRTGAADPAEPTGLLTHHLAHDARCWDFLENLLPRLTAHTAVRLLSARAAFAAPAPEAAETRGAA